MEKKLPGIFRNPIDHPINNNKEKTIALKGKSSIKDETDVTKVEQIKNNLFGSDVKRKINDIFTSSNYVYKANVEITFKDRTIIKKIVGRNSDSLITIDNELIDIDTIIDIKLVK